jgi:geranylgeranyl transferase type-1 subunit beta
MPFHEPHGGYTYCALAALALIDGLPDQATNQRPSGISDPAYTIRWLLSRQTSDDSEEPSQEEEQQEECHHLESSPFPICAGYQGRSNKPPDTCYSWWIPASLSILSSLHLSNTQASRHYLLEKTQHAIGGFGKKEGDPPDVYHSALGLAALALLEEKGLKEIDARLCLSTEAVGWVEGLGWRREITVGRSELG